MRRTLCLLILPIVFDGLFALALSKRPPAARPRPAVVEGRTATFSRADGAVMASRVQIVLR